MVLRASSSLIGFAGGAGWGVGVAGGFARTWYEHMLDIERRRLTLSGTPLLPMTARISAGAGITF